MLRCATSRHAMPCAPCASMQCHARPARPRDMQCHAHPMPYAPFLTFVKHSAHFLCMHALEYSAPGVCLCAEIVSRWSAHQRLSGMVRVSVFPSLDTVCRDHFPPPIMVCLLERAASVRVCVRVNSAVRTSRPYSRITLTLFIRFIKQS